MYRDQLTFFVNPCSCVSSMTHVTAEKKIPTPHELVSILNAADKGDEQDILLTCVHLLGRKSEILSLRWEDVHFDKRFITLWTRKRKDGKLEPDNLPMSNDLFAMLQARWEERKQDRWVFYNEKTDNRYTSLHKLVRRVCIKAGVETIYGFHSLRHFMASYLLNEKRQSLKTVSGLLRHKIAKTTEVYLHSPEASEVLAMDTIDGEFTPKLTFSLPTSTTKPKKNEKKGLDKSSNP